METTGLKKVLVLGSGAFKIGQAGEFDYSGSQALKVLREDGISSVLINPNIATYQTSEGIADKIYFLPVTPFFVEKVIEKERPQGILLSFGGQTALNCGVELYQSGVLEKYGVRVLGTPVSVIMNTEDRELFVNRLDEIDINTIRSYPAVNMDEALSAAKDLGYPLIIRAAYSLGGLGSDFVDNDEELKEVCGKAFAFSPQVLVEKSYKGWKEIEYEVVRDKDDKCITVCNMENFDPLGIHTGESIVVAPAQTLSDEENQYLSDLAVKIVKHLGIVGECNIQFAYEGLVDGKVGDYRVIEVNARLSRSSALASKATGYPLACVAAMIGLGYGLADIYHSEKRGTSALVPPSLDYIICKIPRWDLSKFHGVSRQIGSSMKSVGEVMAIGKSFEEAIQKGLRMIGQGANGFVGNKELKVDDIADALSNPTDSRIFVISKALQAGYTTEQIEKLTKIDRWFLDRLNGIVDTLNQLKAVKTVPEDLMRKAKQQGFSDQQIADAVGSTQDEIRALRKSYRIIPAVRTIETLTTDTSNYMYCTYNSQHSTIHDADRKSMVQSIIVIGSGAYRIGSSVEFDWCSVYCLKELQKHGYRGVMINCNPETVSTDYDMCDQLYFEELTLERVLDIVDLEQPFGVVVSVGGQIPNNLALQLHNNGVNILGTSAVDIDRAEDRHKFSTIVDQLNIDQPRWQEASSMEDINNFIEEVGYPVLVRPSYVLSGAAMNVCYTETKLRQYLSLAADVSAEHPVVISQFLSGCKEIEFDAVADNGNVIVYAISEHIEFAGVHSGDATIQCPPQRLYVETARKIKRMARSIAQALHISGPFNIQFLAQNNEIKVIECNLRASRSFPFVSKVIRINLIEIATKVMLGLHPEPAKKSEFELDYVGVKSSQFSFARLSNADPLLGVDMASTGEVGCLGDTLNEALLLSSIAVGNNIPKKNILISSGTAKQKADLLAACQQLVDNGYKIFATGGTYRYLGENDIPSTRVSWQHEAPDGAENVLDVIRAHKVDMVINIPKNYSDQELDNGFQIRRTAIDSNIPLFTNARLASAFINAFCTLPLDEIQIKPWDEYEAKSKRFEVGYVPREEELVVEVADERHIPLVPEILRTIEDAAKVRGTGIAKRRPEYVEQKIREGKAIIAMCGKEFAGFCYIESWEHGQFVANSGLIVKPEFRGHGLAKKIKKTAFELSRLRFPKAKLFGLTTGLAVMKINTELGYVPVTFSELTTDPTFWKGCESCINYDVLCRNNNIRCLCTGMLYDPNKKK